MSLSADKDFHQHLQVKEIRKRLIETGNGVQAICYRERRGLFQDFC